MSKYDEVVNCRLMTLKRKGRVTTYKSNLDSSQIEQAKQTMSVQLPTVKKELYDLLSEIETLILDDLNPLDALGHNTTKNLLVDPETNRKDSFDNSQLEVEIVQNVILKNKQENYRKVSTYENLKKFDDLLKDFRDKLYYYLMYSIYSDETLNSIEKEILFDTILNFLILRGDAFPFHYKKVALELFSDSRIKKMFEKLGFTIEEYFETIEEIQRQNIAFIKERVTKLDEVRKDFFERFDKYFKEFDDPQKTVEMCKAQVGEDLLDKRCRDFLSIGLKDNYKIIPNEITNEKILDLLSLEFGCNEHWTSPLDKSDIELKPLIHIDKEYYCFLIPHLVRNVIPIIESIFSEKFSEKEFKKYIEIKSDFFEQKSFELLRNVLPKATIQENLYYPINEEGEDKYPEIDGVVSYKDSLLLVEIKAKKRRSIAGRKDILTISKGDFKKNISEAFEQSKRALDYVLSSEEVGFYNNNHTEIMKIKKEDYKNIFLVNISLEAFEEYSTALNKVKLWDSKLLCGTHYPFAISIYDLMVITDILENSDDFIKYLQERISLNRKQEISSFDEIDYFGYFLKHGTLSKTSDLPKSEDTIIVNGYSSDIERYYSFLQGEIEYAKKPVRNKTHTEIIREKLEKGSLSKNNRCWCGSGKKYKHCCCK
ncbi:MAG TPA: hypothetical protein DC024_06420 [Clostridiales bacterium]|nr:hypothetical protein [Clostridiales bacterium]